MTAYPASKREQTKRKYRKRKEKKKGKGAGRHLIDFTITFGNNYLYFLSWQGDTLDLPESHCPLEAEKLDSQISPNEYLN